MKRVPSDAASGITVTFDPNACEAHESPPPFAFRHRIIPAVQELVAERFGAIKAESGPDAIARLCSAKCTNEENYLMQKLFRAGVGTNNLDHCARL